MDSQNNSRSSEELQTRLIEKYKVLKKENQDLMDKLNKVTVSSTTDINIEKEQHRKSLLEIAKLSRENKDLKSRVRQLENSLQNKDLEIQDLKGRIELKTSFEVKHQEKDLALFQKYIGRNPVETSAQDSKILSIIRIFENQKERLEDENRKLFRELEEITERLKRQDQERNVIRKEFNQTHEAISKDFLIKIESLESENESIVKDNLALRNNLEKLHVENSRLQEENYEIKRRYDDLKSKLDDTAQEDSSARQLEHTDLTDSRPPGQGNVVFSLPSSQQTGGKGENEDNFYSFKPYANVTDLTLFECRKLISEVLEMFSIRNPSQLLPAIRKMEKVIQAIPRLQGLVQEVSDIILPRVDRYVNGDQIELIIPCLKSLCAQVDSAKELRELRGDLISLLKLKDAVPNHEILRKVDLLVQESIKSSEKEGDNYENAVLVEQLSKVLGEKPNLTSFKKLLQTFDDIKQFIFLVKKKLNLDPSMSSQACLTYLLKHIENTKREDQAVEIVNRLRKMLLCSAEEVIQRVEEYIINVFG